MAKRKDSLPRSEDFLEEPREDDPSVQAILEAVPPENARRSELLNLIAAFDYFEPIDPQLVAKDSLLREFIGGGSYQYH